jgi:hypothetical protein
MHDFEWTLCREGAIHKGYRISKAGCGLLRTSTTLIGREYRNIALGEL